jgi:hypothetical protein
MPRFIDDLVPIILESHSHWWPQDLIRLSTVSSAWLGHARRLLYECPGLWSFAACHLFERSLRNNEYLTTLIRGIDLRPRAAHSYSATGQITEKEMASLRYILSLVGFRKVILGGELSVKAERFLHSLAHPESVTHLQIEGDLDIYCSYLRSQKPSSLEWDEVIAFKFPNLRSLKLSNLELDIIHPFVPYELEIADLILDNVHIIGGYLHHLLNQSWSHLRRLFVIARSASEFDEHVRLMLDCCRPNIQTLHYDIQCNPRSSTAPLFGGNSQPCPSLRQLYLRDVEIGDEGLFTIGQTFPNLETLTVAGRSVRVSADDWTAFIRSGALPSLQYLTIPGGTHYPPFMHWLPEIGIPILKASAQRNIRCIYPLMPPVQS